MFFYEKIPPPQPELYYTMPPLRRQVFSNKYNRA